MVMKSEQLFEEDKKINNFIYLAIWGILTEISSLW